MPTHTQTHTYLYFAKVAELWQQKLGGDSFLGINTVKM